VLRLKEVREAQDPPVSQEALARRAGVSVKTVHRAERLGTAHSETIRALARGLGVPIDDLFEPEPDPEKVA
jgi:transcriptional regulator with XRE-family HTH domain